MTRSRSRRRARHATRTQRGAQRQYDPESRPRMPFRPSAIRADTQQRRVRVLRRWVRKSSRFNQSEQSSRHATRTRRGAQRKHVNMIRSHGHECHFVRVQSGDIRWWRPIRADTQQRRVRVLRRWVRRSSRLDQSERSSHARYPSEGIKGTVPSFLPFPSITQSRNDVDLCVNRITQ